LVILQTKCEGVSKKSEGNGARNPVLQEQSFTGKPVEVKYAGCGKVVSMG